jgi:hypothetical protein
MRLKDRNRHGQKDDTHQQNDYGKDLSKEIHGDVPVKGVCRRPLNR